MTTLLPDYLSMILFVWVLGNQAGMPLPVVPAILAAAAMGYGPSDLVGVVAVVVVAALCADVAWYGVGRLGGVSPNGVGVRSGVTAVVDQGLCPQLKDILAR